MFSIEDVGISTTSKGVVISAASDSVLSSAADEDVIACCRSDGVMTATAIDGVIVSTENDALRMVISVNNIAAHATGNHCWPDDDCEIDVVELQVGGSSNGHVGEVDNEGFWL